MDPQTFEQEEVAADLFGSAAAFLVPDIIVTLNLAPDGKAVSGVRHATLTQSHSWPCNSVRPERFHKEGITNVQRQPSCLRQCQSAVL